MRRPSSLPTHSRASDQLDRMEIKAAEKAIEKAASLENADRGSIATILRKLCDISVLASLLGADAERKAHIMHSKLPTAWLQAVVVTVLLLTSSLLYDDSVIKVGQLGHLRGASQVENAGRPLGATKQLQRNGRCCCMERVMYMSAEQRPRGC